MSLARLPAAYGPRTTVYNRFNRWSRRGFWKAMLTALAEAPGWIRRFSADKGYDADWLRADLRNSRVTPIIPGKRGRKRRILHDRSRYRERWRIEAMFSRLKDFRRIAARYDKLARNYASALALAAIVAFWC